MNGMESVRDLLDGADGSGMADMRWRPPANEPPADHEEPNP